jgi:hypothetical protein
MRLGGSQEEMCQMMMNHQATHHPAWPPRILLVAIAPQAP